ncbi:MAG: beta-ketoacyl-ACP synthase I [Proteobacteria bacterium]|nr:beta-ketoacyl-ACP synthase I [Pseudomonadota bacterium]
MTKRVVITGLGIVSCLGNDLATVAVSLRNGTSGITTDQTSIEMGLRSHVSGRPTIDFNDHIDRKQLRFMADAAAYAFIAMEQAIRDAGLSDDQVSNVRTGIIAGSGGASAASQTEAADILRSKGIRRVGPYRVTQTMGSTVSACLATPFKIKGVNYSISSACSTSAHCIGAAVEQIQLGKQDIVFAGGGEELHWTMTSLFDAMGALSTQYNDTPTQAARAYDQNRDGFVIAGGGGMLVVESLEHALARNAKIYAEITGIGATSDGFDMVAPSGEGASRCMQLAMATATGPIDYINAHGTSTPAGDMQELKAIKAAFAEQELPLINSTKSLSGHSLGAAGVQEAIYALIMQQQSFVAASANIDQLDPEAEGLPIVRTRVDNIELTRIMSNSFGFGGTNASLVFEKYRD